MSGALEGIRVVDFTWVLAGPIATQYLGHHGAEVIRIESSARLDVSRRSAPYAGNKPGLNRSAYFSTFNASKRSVNLNMTRPVAKDVVRSLVAAADVVIENFTPKAMRNWGLGYEELRRVRPDLIMISMSAHGQTGPYALHPGIGHLLTGLAGFAHFTGWADRWPIPPHGAYTDYFIPHFAVSALCAALDYRRRTGHGQHIDLAQTETSLTFLAPWLLEHSAAGRQGMRDGNRHPFAAPHNAYPCRGEDRWTAVAVFTDEEWRALCNAAGRREWADDPRFKTARARKRHEAELDGMLEGWTRGQDAYELMQQLQQAGVRAGVVQNVEDLHRDPQLLHRQHYLTLEHPEMGTAARYDAPGARLPRTPMQPRAAPCFGEGNEYVYRELLGLSDDQIADLYAEGVVE